MTISPITFAPLPHKLTADEVNAAMATLVAAINGLQVTVDGLAAAAAPDLSAYATNASLTAHTVAAVPHVSIVKGAAVSAGKSGLLQSAQVTLDGSGNFTHTWASSYATGAILSAMAVLVAAAAAAVSVVSYTTTQVVLKGPAAGVVNVWGWGYV